MDEDKWKRKREEAEAELFGAWFQYNQLYAQLENEKRTGGKLGRIEELEKMAQVHLDKYNAIQRFLRD